MADNVLKTQKELIAEANKTRRDRIEKGNKARAEQREEARKINNLRERREGMNVAYQQFKNDGIEAIDTEPGMISRLFGVTKNEPKYQAAREMKKALESERARANIPDEADEQRKAMYDSAKKDDMDLPAGARTYKKGGKVKAKKMAKGGSVSSASKRADGCAVKGKTKGRMI